METIWKYPLKIKDTQTVLIPHEGKILSAAVQCGQICIWVLVESEFKPQPRTLGIVGTGNPFPKSVRSFIGTVQMPPFVWHVLEMNNPQ